MAVAMMEREARAVVGWEGRLGGAMTAAETATAVRASRHSFEEAVQAAAGLAMEGLGGVRRRPGRTWRRRR